MPVKYIMFYLKDLYWGIWEKLPIEKPEELKEKLKASLTKYSNQEEMYIIMNPA